VALGYPLLRVGTKEVRDGPVHGLTAADPPILFVSGDRDPHVDLPSLESACADSAAATQVLKKNVFHLGTFPGSQKLWVQVTRNL